MRKLIFVFLSCLYALVMVSCGYTIVDDEPTSTDIPQEKENITLAVWHIGHFSGGGSPNSSITANDYNDKLSAFRQYVYSDINADIIGLAEYSKNFGTSVDGEKLASSVLFNGYQYQFIGSQSNYSRNALYSKKQLSNTKQNAFECNKTVTITHTNLIKASDYYYVTTDFLFRQ